MNQGDLDKLVVKVINHLKQDTEHQRQAILMGDLSHEQYLRESGILNGIEQAMSVLIEEAGTFIKKEIDDDE